MLYYCRISSLRSSPDLDRVIGEARRQCLLAGGRAVADLRRRKYKYRRKKRENILPARAHHSRGWSQSPSAQDIDQDGESLKFTTLF